MLPSADCSETRRVPATQTPSKRDQAQSFRRPLLPKRTRPIDVPFRAQSVTLRTSTTAIAVRGNLLQLPPVIHAVVIGAYGRLVGRLLLQFGVEVKASVLGQQEAYRYG